MDGAVPCVWFARRAGKRRAPRFLLRCLVAWLAAAVPLGATMDAAPAAGPGSPERTLSTHDRQLYEAIFELQANARWRAADRLMERLGDDLLLGHVLAERYLDTERHRTEYEHVTDWLERYADHPQAHRIYRLAVVRKRPGQPRPVRPMAKPEALRLPAAEPLPYQSTKSLTRAQYREAARLKARIRRNLRRVHLSKTERLLERADVHRLFDTVELDEAYAGLAAGWLYYGDPDRAYEIVDPVAARSGAQLPLSHWTAGLAAWRLGRFRAAARHFESLALAESAPDRNRAAGAYWAARAHLRLVSLAAAQRWLSRAAGYPRSFYGFLARRRLGLDITFDFEPPSIASAQVSRLRRTPEGARALALLNLGRFDLAEQELLWFDRWREADFTGAILGLAVYGDMPHLGLRLAGRLAAAETGDTGRWSLDSAAYPIPAWQPEGGFRLDRALILAFIRQESSFDPWARSPDGALGLMQLMPRTARTIDRDRRMKAGGRAVLHDAALNMDLGQRYLRRLLASPRVDGDLLRLAVAYNAGLGNFASWESRMAYGDDPLLFIETLPKRETRLFVKRVMTNLWVYRHRLGQPAHSLDALAQGRWPEYRGLDERPQIASRESAPSDPEPPDAAAP